MRRIVLIAFMAINAGIGAYAQDYKRLEANLQVAGGLFLESGFHANEQNPGAVLRLSAGVDYRFDEHWSVMPGAGIRCQLGDVRHFGWVGGDPDGMSLADFFVVARYHTVAEGARIVLGLGPALSCMVQPDTYYVDADPSDPLDGKEKFHRFDIGIQPSLTFLVGKHFQWGVEANFGLLNVMKQYPEYDRTGTIRFQYLALTCGLHF